MTIKKKVGQLVKKYGTSDPFEIAKAMEIEVVYENLGKSLGYFSSLYRTTIIHINESIPYKKQLYTIAHELGHVVLHPEENTAFLKANTFCLTDKNEVEANTFAIELLFSNTMYENISFHQAIEEYGMPEQLLIKFFYDQNRTNDLFKEVIPIQICN
ncbi:ImmA/IrrE family metallo-endopeptidase [Virgibacillus salarius]|uniref:ImmA/IrrE family metallo-endopeptidase n=1 Tax=Virgibacillus salarius TaxID=447199 RepID=UPI002493CAF5|nr:ImmA/IrrE family metallo-endopeptidase [Virgibacillus salarius]WBX80161.1 ImmA/IrrE family metallo-endopeptidase [Virgibacillus salarius]